MAYKTNNNKWIINRIGLINFWYYDEQEFYFSNGKLLLRGTNGSGKSVTMQSFIPLLLDGNKSPERLDPFGSRARKLENYLLGEDEQGLDENTGYLYMEFIKKETGNTITVGMGLRARKGKPLDFWGFSITDGRRMGSDFLLYKDIGEKIPLSKQELKNRIGSGGDVKEGQGDYMDMVNRLLFGFENIEEYDELVKLLVQLRTPKLSKEFKPTVVYEIMNNSLQPLSDDDLRPLSEAIENMDKIKSHLEMLEESKKAADRLGMEYNKYNRFVLLEKAKEFISCYDELECTEKSEIQLKKESEVYKENQSLAIEEHQRLKSDRERLDHRKQQLEESDFFKASQEIEKIKEELTRLESDQKTKEEGLQKKKDLEMKQKDKLVVLNKEKETGIQGIEDLFKEMDMLAKDIYFDEHEFMRKELMENFLTSYKFKSVRQLLDHYKKKISESKKALEEHKVIERRYDESLQETDEARRLRDEARRTLDKAVIRFDETKEEYTESIYSWEKNNEQLKIPTADMPAVTRAINGYGTSGSFDAIVTEIRKHYNNVASEHQRCILKVQSIKEGLEKNLAEKQAELLEWQNKKDPEPLRDNKVINNRKNLEKKGIPFLPFYSAVEFQSDTPDDVKGRLEEALIDMGILDALIIPEKYFDQISNDDIESADKIIHPNPQFFRQDLTTYLKPAMPEESSITYEDVENVLKSIFLDDKDSETAINENGEYVIGIIKGNTSGIYIPKYIGAEARKRYRSEMIQNIQTQIVEIKLQIEVENDKIKEIQQSKVVLDTEFEEMPPKTDLEASFENMKSLNDHLMSKEKEAAGKEQVSSMFYDKLKNAKTKVLELTKKMELPLNLDAYERAENQCTQYRDRLGDLDTQHAKLIQLLGNIIIYEENIKETSGDIDRISCDLETVFNKIIETKNIRKNYEEILSKPEYEYVRAEIERCVSDLKEIPLRLENAIVRATKNEEKYNNAMGRLEEIGKQIIGLQIQNEGLRDSFILEYELGYVVQYTDEKDCVRIAKKVCSQFKGDDKNGKQRDDYAKTLQDKYHENYNLMAEYSLRMEYIFEQFEDTKNEKLDKILLSRKRLDLLARIQGKEVNFNTLTAYIGDSIAETEKLLRESDRQLFEDILANTVGKKIRARIYHSEQWVKKMNSLMESMNTSSGLSFSLAWKSRVAESEDQLNTKELVDLLQTDAVLLTEESLSRLTEHFRSKIVLARKEQEDKGSSQSFHATMKDILDYRKWFEFQLFYRKTGEIKKELTDNAFYKFSGGEKAMAMYVPLFSAVYARYDGAKKDCPRIISLDEAFAGVDENNIRDMFRLLEELDLSFIINSQSLWGDYETVSSLSIYELIRPNNADFVTTIRYKWNGKVKELVTESL